MKIILLKKWMEIKPQSVEKKAKTTVLLYTTQKLLEVWQMKLIKKNTFTILIGLLFTTCLFVVVNNLSEDDSNYVAIEVEHGDTLWSYAKKYSDYSSMSEQRFIDWVEKHNELENGEILVGESIILPIETHHSDLMLASE